MQWISAHQLRSMLSGQGDFVLVDVLNRSEFERLHIPGSLNIPEPEMGRRALQELPDRDREIVVYCSSTASQASARAARTLRALGYRSVLEYKSGIEGWLMEGYPLQGSAVRGGSRLALSPWRRQNTPLTASIS